MRVLNHMNADLEGLVRLQRTESDLKRVQSDLADVPRRKAELEAALTAERARLEAARQQLEASQKNRRRLEGELQDLEAKRSRYKGQLMEVKTNKEYTAMLHEIEAVEREIRGREDQVLGEMERAEALTAEIKQEEGVFKAAEEQHRTQVRSLGDEEARLRVEAQRLGEAREGQAAALSPAVLELFQRVARLRGVAVAEARDGICQVCHLKLRLQMFSEIKRNDQIFQCPACNRILYYEAPAPVSAPQP
jgi:predicted  nucleic acid-binding Zn-ribbon protein